MTETPRIQLADFQSAAEAVGYRFQCPMCGNVASADDFKRAGANSERVAQECIGRTMKPMPKPQKGKTPCDWAAFGLFRALGKGLIVVMPDGKEIHTFAIAPKTPAAPADVSP